MRLASEESWRESSRSSKRISWAHETVFTQALIEQLALAISDPEETQTEEEIKAEIAAPAALKEKRSRRQAGAPSASGKSSARAHRLTSALRLRHMRQFDAAQTWRTRDLLARMRAAPLGAE